MRCLPCIIVVILFSAAQCSRVYILYRDYKLFEYEYTRIIAICQVSLPATQQPRLMGFVLLVVCGIGTTTLLFSHTLR